MFFEASLKGDKYFIEVFEHTKHWLVCLQKEGAEKEVHKIPKENYRKMDGGISFLFNNSSYMVDVVGQGIEWSVYTRGSYRVMQLLNDEALLHESLKTGQALGGGHQLISGMPGKIVDILVKEGDEVPANGTLLIMEAMKMENEMKTPRPVKIKQVSVTKGQSVEAGAVLIVYERE